MAPSLSSFASTLIASAPSMPVSATVGFALAAALIGGLWRKRLTPGVGEAVFATAITGAALLTFAGAADGHFHARALGRTFTCLTLLWYALGRIDARRVSAAARDNGDTSRVGPTVLASAALVCGVAALVQVLASPDGLGGNVAWSPAATDYSLLLAVALAVWVFRTGDWAPYPALALLACFASRTVAANYAAPPGLSSKWILLVGGVTSLAVVLGIVIADWLRRKRAWLKDPRPLPKSAPLGSDLFGPVAVLAIIAGALAVGNGHSTVAALGVIFFALTCLVIGHMRAWLWAGEAGLALVALAIVSICTAWIAAGWAGALIGAAVAGGYLQWLARFWRQQLDNGRAWTTTGRLIPVAHRLAVTASIVALAAAATLVLFGDADASGSTTSAAVTLVLLLLAARFFARDAADRDSFAAALAACCWLAAAAAPATRLVSVAFDGDISPVIALAAGASLLALFASASKPSPNARAVFAAYIYAAIPICVLFTSAGRGLDSQAGAALILTLAALIVAAMTDRRTKPADIAEHA